MAVPARRVAAGLIPPLLILATALWLRGHVAVDPASLRASRGLFGPGFWPMLMLAGVAFCAAGWLAMNVVALLRPSAGGVAAEPQAAQYDTGRAIVGVGLALAYGAVIPAIGFGFATLLFVLGWMLLGGYRRPLGVAAVALLGVAGVLWFFAGIALMPLDLGKGAFEGATVAVYRLLRIY